MTIFIASDHGGFELKNKLIEYLQNKNIRIVDIGNLQYDPIDDYPDFAKKLCETVLQKPEDSCGIVICRSGAGVSIMANRFKGIRCTLGINPAQVSHSKEDDNINVLALASDYTDFDNSTQMVDVFLSSKPKTEEKYVRRRTKLDL